MKYRDFKVYVDSFEGFRDRPALTIRPFLRIDRLTYGDVRELSYRAANFLRAQGLTSGDRVMIIAGNSPEWVILFLGCQLTGIVTVPVDAAASEQTVETYLKQTYPKILVKDRLLLPDLQTDAQVLAMEDMMREFNLSSDQKVDRKLDPSRPAHIVFTSGTTADPKGVVLTQINLLSNIEGVQHALNVDPNWRLLSVLPLSHMYEMTGTLTVLSRGAHIHYMPRVSPLAISKALNEYHITTMLAIPQLLVLFLNRIHQTAEREGKARTLATVASIARIFPMPLRHALFHSVHSHLGGKLSLVVTGGAPIPGDVAVGWERMGVKSLQGYGLTETSPILTVNRLHERRAGSAGKALDNVQLRIGDDNEIQARGPSVFHEYLDNPAATKEVFTVDGWFKTGDTGKIQNDWLYIQGRLKFAIVLSSGLKVFPEDIELVAAKHKLFKSFCVIGKHEADSESVQAVIISDASDSAVESEVGRINAALESFQHISSWRRWPDEDFPRTRLLKIDRRKVQQWAASSGTTVSDKPASIDHDQLLALIRMTAQDDHLAVKDSDRLANIGLDSLRRLNLVALIEEYMGVQIPEEAVKHNTTVKGVREMVKAGKPAASPEHIAAWPYRRLPRLVGNFIRDFLLGGILRIWVHIDVEGQEKLEKLPGPAIFIFNHTDDFDAPVVYAALPRFIRRRVCVAMADDVMKQHKFLGFVAKFCYGAINFARKEPYLPSLERIGTFVDQGWHVVLSPEGRIRNKPGLQPFKSGIGLLAVSLGVPVVPVKTFGLVGTVPLHSKWPKKHSRVLVRIGNPVTFAPDDDYDEATKRLRDIMEGL